MSLGLVAALATGLEVPRVEARSSLTERHDVIDDRCRRHLPGRPAWAAVRLGFEDLGPDLAPVVVIATLGGAGPSTLPVIGAGAFCRAESIGPRRYLRA